MRLAHQPETRIAHRGHPCIGHHEHLRTGASPLDQLRHPRGFVALVEGQHLPAHLDPEARNQRAEFAGVFGRHHIGLLQRLHEPHRGVAGIA